MINVASTLLEAMKRVARGNFIMNNFKISSKKIHNES